MNEFNEIANDKNVSFASCTGLGKVPEKLINPATLCVLLCGYFDPDGNYSEDFAAIGTRKQLEVYIRRCIPDDLTLLSDCDDAPVGMFGDERSIYRIADLIEHKNDGILRVRPMLENYEFCTGDAIAITKVA